jgi:hypothetical protein
MLESALFSLQHIIHPLKVSLVASTLVGLDAHN